MSNVSSASRRRRHARISSKHSQLRAARPIPPYTTRLSGLSATSGSKLFWIMRYAASDNQFLQVRTDPRGARINRAGSVLRNSSVSVLTNFPPLRDGCQRLQELIVLARRTGRDANVSRESGLAPRLYDHSVMQQPQRQLGRVFARVHE